MPSSSGSRVRALSRTSVAVARSLCAGLINSDLNHIVHERHSCVLASCDAEAHQSCSPRRFINHYAQNGKGLLRLPILPGWKAGRACASETQNASMRACTLSTVPFHLDPRIPSIGTCFAAFWQACFSRRGLLTCCWKWGRRAGAAGRGEEESQQPRALIAPADDESGGHDIFCRKPVAPPVNQPYYLPACRAVECRELVFPFLGPRALMHVIVFFFFFFLKLTSLLDVC